MGDRSKLVAAPAEVPLGTITLFMSPLNDLDMAELDEWVRAQYVRNALAGVKDAERETWERVMKLAMGEALRLTWTHPPGNALMVTPEGIVRLAWQGCKRNMPDLTYEKLRAELLDPRNIAVFRERFAQHNGVPQGGPPGKGRPLAKKKSTR